MGLGRDWSHPIGGFLYISSFIPGTYREFQDHVFHHHYNLSYYCDVCHFSNCNVDMFVNHVQTQHPDLPTPDANVEWPIITPFRQCQIDL